MIGRVNPAIQLAAVSSRLSSDNRQALQVPDLSIAMKGASPG